MTIERVAVFSASARPGLAQVRQLKAAGYKVRAVTRSKLHNSTLEGTEIVPADLNDPESLRRACTGVDAVFFTSPTFTEVPKAHGHMKALGTAARDAGVKRFVYNTTSWHPDRLIGVPTMDDWYMRSRTLLETGVPATIVRPSLFMDNLLTRWVKPWLLRDHEFAYPHKLDLDVSWICLDDVGRYMIATMSRPEYEGRFVDIGGPQALRPTQVAELLSEALGHRITYRVITPREFGERMYEVFKDVCGTSREEYVSSLEKHYQFKNVANPFLVPMEEMMKRLPVRPTPMREWLRQQDWSANPKDEIGSVSG